MAGEETALGLLASKAVRALSEFFDTESSKIDVEDVGRARIAASVLSSYTKLKQVQSSREATTLSMARELARDKEEMALYIKMSMPNAPLVKALKAASSPQPEEGQAQAMPATDETGDQAKGSESD